MSQNWDIHLVARVGVADIDSAAVFGRVRRRECDTRLKLTGGYQLSSLQHTGGMPRLVTADGSAFAKPAW